jgi:flagellar assembly protein FliH
MSSEAPSASAPAPDKVATYAFEQLEAPVGGAGSPADLLSSAWNEAEQIRAQARAAGEAEGRADGLAAARAEVDTALAAMASALAELEQLREQLVSELEHDAAELALRLSEQVLAGALDVEPERVLDVARNALRRVTERRHVVLVVNPADLEILSDSVATLKAELGGIESCDVQSDRRVGRGGVILRTDAGEIDARIEAGLERAREIVAATLKGEQHES